MDGTEAGHFDSGVQRRHSLDGTVPKCSHQKMQRQEDTSERTDRGIWYHKSNRPGVRVRGVDHHLARTTLLMD